MQYLLQATDQNIKCLAKEASRQEVLNRTMRLPCLPTDPTAMALLEKSKQAAVATILKPAVQQKQNKKSAKKHRPVKAPKKKPVASRKPKAKTGQPTPQLVLQDMPDALATGITTIHLCGCRHGDFSALKSFSKADVAHYIRPNKFLDGRSCLDCAQAVLEMRPTTASKREVVFYCDKASKAMTLRMGTLRNLV